MSIPEKTPALPDSTRSRQTRTRALVFLTVAALSALALSSLDDPHAYSQEVTPAKPDAQGPGPVERNTSTRLTLIPDQRVYHGSPPTVIDLLKTFAGSEIGEQGIDSLAVILNKKEKVVLAKIVGSQLRLDWGKKGKSEVSVEIRTTDGKTYRTRFLVEVWQADYWKLLFTVVGGLGIFLLGMKNLSGGLQAIAGNRLRRMIALVTGNRLMATGVGTLVTCLVQSSSITTVMVVGFVNSGFMTLTQSVGVIMGANIGTTITGWTLALKIGKYGLPLLGLGAFGYLFSRRELWRYVAMTCMGFGMIFFGLEVMKNGFAMVKDLPDFEAWFNTFRADSYFGVLKCAAVGCVLTFLVQSSSATLGITIGLAQIGVIPFETAGALVLGENIGTTITAWLASFGATTAAKRAAYFHVIFNVLGVAWITAIFSSLYLPAVKMFLGLEGAVSTEQVTVAIATTHSGFNIMNTIVFLPLAGYIAKMLERVVPDRAAKEKPHLTSLDIRILETTVIAVEQSRVEVLKMAHGCAEMMDWMRDILASESPDEDLIKKAFNREEVLDDVQDEIVTFMTHLLATGAPHDVVDEGRRQLRMADEYESVSDYIALILKSHLKLVHSNLGFVEEVRAELRDIHAAVSDYLALVGRAYEQRQMDILSEARSEGDAITHRVKDSRDSFLQRMSREKFDPQVIVAYNAQLNAYRRVRDHILNVAEALAGEK